MQALYENLFLDVSSGGLFLDRFGCWEKCKRKSVSSKEETEHLKTPEAVSLVV
jgi:hypothetical protein